MLTFSIEKDAPWVVEVSLHASPHALSFSRRNTAFDSWLPAACTGFHVFDETASTDVARIGPIAKRSAPGPLDVLKLAAGEVSSTQVDLGRCFVFLAGHSYRITALGLADVFVVSTEPVRGTPAQDSVHPQHMKPSREHAGKRAVGFQGCSLPQQTIVQSAIVNAAAGMTQAVDKVINQGCANVDYAQMFGEYSQERLVLRTKNMHSPVIVYLSFCMYPFGG
jgi:hypothetical protein